MKAIDFNDYYTTAQAASIIGVTRQRILQMIGEGKLPSQKIPGNTILIKKSAVSKLQTQEEK